MSDLNRRQFLKNALVNLVQAAGSATLVSAAITQARADEPRAGSDARAGDEAAGPPARDLQQRADELAAAAGPGPDSTPDGQANVELAQFLNGGWRNGANRNRRWRNGPFRNGLWNNGGWRNSPWINGGWPNGPWRNAPWRNGNWINGGWRW
jgi:hypothetical protein